MSVSDGSAPQPDLDGLIAALASGPAVHHVVGKPQSAPDVEAALNRAAEEGWDFYFSDGAHLFFKRPALTFEASRAQDGEGGKLRCSDCGAFARENDLVGTCRYDDLTVRAADVCVHGFEEIDEHERARTDGRGRPAAGRA